MTRTAHIKTTKTTLHGNCRYFGHGLQWTERVRTTAQGNRKFRRNNKKICREAMGF